MACPCWVRALFALASDGGLPADLEDMPSSIRLPIAPDPSQAIARAPSATGFARPSPRNMLQRQVSLRRSRRRPEGSLLLIRESLCTSLSSKLRSYDTPDSSRRKLLYVAPSLLDAHGDTYA